MQAQRHPRRRAARQSARSFILDDRGHRIQAADSELFSLEGAISEPLLDDLFQLRESTMHRQRFTWIDLVVIVLPLLSLPPLHMWSGGSPPGWLFLCVLAWLGVFVGWKSVRWRDVETENAVARALIGAGRCGSCTYPLEGLEPCSDGCMVCPECGAAWRRGSLS